MKRRAILGAAIPWICWLLLASGAPAQPPPVHRVDDHWSAWDPPTSFPEGARIYRIVAGDTLWDLAAEWLGDPYLWPQIWERNQYIIDAHWIYPGDPLVLPASVGEGELAEVEGVAAPPLEEGEAAPAAEEEAPAAADELDRELGAAGTEAPVPLGYESDIYCSGYIGGVDEEFAHRIVGSEYEFLNPTLSPRPASEIQGIWGKSDTQKFGLGLGDIVYLDSGRADGLAPGELLTAVQRGPRIDHPATGELLGRFHQYLGRVRVLSAQEDSSIGEIIFSCYPMPVGTVLTLFEPEPVPLRRMTPMRPVNLPARDEELDGSPMIVYAQDSVITLGAGSLIYIDHGAAQDVAPGDVFTIYRRGRRGFPPVVLGELGVLSVHERSALARILRSRYAVYVGDTLELK